METRFYTFDFEVSYRYYKITFDSSNGHLYVAIGAIKLYKNEESLVSRKKSSGNYSIPMATTNKILARRNDDREGLLVLANDPNNYGDLYVVGKDGKSHLTKSGIKSEVIWEGSLNLGQGSVNVLLENINVSKYREVTLEFGITDATHDTLATHQSTINSPSTTQPMYTSSVSSGSHYFVTHFIFKESNQILFTETFKGGWGGTSVLTKIIGIY